jgi:hypothetical protein
MFNVADDKMQNLECLMQLMTGVKDKKFNVADDKVQKMECFIQLMTAILRHTNLSNDGVRCLGPWDLKRI